MKKFFSQTAFMAIIASLLWSSAFVGVKIGLKYHTPLQFAGLRFLLAGFMLLFVVGDFAKFKKETRENFGFVCLVGFLQVTLQYSLFYMGINLLPASVSAMIVGSSPLFVALIAHFVIPDDRLTGTKIVSIILGIAGVAVIAIGRNSLTTGQSASLSGIVLLLLNNIAAGINNVVVARKRQSISPIVLTSSSLLIGGLSISIISIPIEGVPRGQFPVEYFVALLWLGFLSAAAISIWNTLLRRPGVKVSELNVWKFLIPVCGAALSWALLSSESPDIISVSGMLLIAFALIIQNLPVLSRKRSTSSNHSYTI